VEQNHLPKDAPNILIILLDDVGFGQASTFGGEINTPTLSKLASEGLSYNAFHTTAICSPTRAALLTGRNHQRVGSGTIAERAVDWDGYTGVIPRASATLAKVLGDYGYKTAAIGKWHNTPADQTTAMGPFTLWPTGEGIGFDYFYGFLSGETSQWEPRLVENFNAIEPPHDEKYHLSEDLAQHGIDWLRRHQAFSPDKPFFLYWAPGAGHGPHQIFKEWADKYKGKFDDGWDAYRERVFKRQKELGWIPADTKLTAPWWQGQSARGRSPCADHFQLASQTQAPGRQRTTSHGGHNADRAGTGWRQSESRKAARRQEYLGDRRRGTTIAARRYFGERRSVPRRHHKRQVEAGENRAIAGQDGAV
jgi:arylsulfatase